MTTVGVNAPTAITPLGALSASRRPRAASRPFPGHDEIVFVTFDVIAVLLMAHGLVLSRVLGKPWTVSSPKSASASASTSNRLSPP